MDFDKKTQIADEIFFLVLDKVSDPDLYVEFNPDDDGTINTELGSQLYYEIEAILDVYG
tara:strand:- start:1280 stop:1456 length:177 start_codon:yes stop_codon:yes gene_type:complete